MSQYLTVNSFGGINRLSQSTNLADNEVLQATNLLGIVDVAATFTPGILTKVPPFITYGAIMPAAGKIRGAAFYEPDSGVATNNYILIFSCTTDYTVGNLYAYSFYTNTWSTLAISGFNKLPYHVQMIQLGNKLYGSALGPYSSSGTPLWKWHEDFGTSFSAVRDKSFVTSLATRTLTWAPGADLDLVTADADVSATIKPGMWIRKSSGSSYWDEVKSVTNGGLNINLISDSSDSGASAAGGSQYTGQAFGASGGIWPLTIEAWKEKLWAANNDYGGNYSTLYWSVTADPDNWDTTAGGGSLSVGNYSSERIVALKGLGDYLFIFKDFSYYVYRWTGDLDVPIEFVRKFDYGCNSWRTVQIIEDSIFYFTGNELRRTNGSTDVNISDKMRNLFNYYALSNPSSDFYSFTGTDDNMPSSWHDEERQIYWLNCVGGTNIYIYDYKKNIWGGEVDANWITPGIGFSFKYNSQDPYITIFPQTATNILKRIATSGGRYQADSTLVTKAYDFGTPAKKKKVYWIEFWLHPHASSSTTLTLQYFLDWGPTQVQETAETYVLAESTAETDTVVRKRFSLKGKECYNIIFQLTDDATAAGFSILGWTIAYDILDTP